MRFFHLDEKSFGLKLSAKPLSIINVVKKKKHNRTKILINPNFKQMPNKKHIYMFIWKTQAKRTYRSAENKYILSIKTIALCGTRV